MVRFVRFSAGATGAAANPTSDARRWPTRAPRPPGHTAVEAVLCLLLTAGSAHENRHTPEFAKHSKARTYRPCQGADDRVKTGLVDLEGLLAMGLAARVVQ
jgi:hypothetical protein